MRNARLIPALLAVAIFHSAAGANTLGVNLISNPGAEASPGAPNYGTTIAPAGWTTTGSFSAIRYDGGNPVDELNPEDSQLAAGEANFFWGGNSAVSTASQIIDISAQSAAIDAGVSATLSAYLGGYDGQLDNMQISATFYDASSNILGKMQIGPITADERANITQILFTKAVQIVPPGSRSIEILMTATRLAGTSNDGYADNLRFVLGNQSTSSSKVLTPQTTIEDPPAVIVKGRKATIVMQPFNRADAGGRSAALEARAPARKKKKKKPTVSYTATVAPVGATSRDVRSITSKKNQITFNNLAPGSYTATYLVRAVKGKKTLFQTNISPARPFVID